MSALLLIALAAGAAVQHGTEAQCAEWYADDWRKELECTTVTDPKVLKQMAHYSGVCDSLAALVKGNGLVLVSAKLKDGEKPISCDGYESFNPAKPRQGG